MLRWKTAGEAHGEGLVALLEGIPFGLAVSTELIEEQLRRRRVTYGRGLRMKSRKERAKLLAGVVQGRTIGSPIAVLVEEEGRPAGGELKPFSAPRPGHADLPGSYKYKTTDLHLVWERSSARETAARVAAGAVCRALLDSLGIRLGSYTAAIGKIEYPHSPEDKVPPDPPSDGARCPDPQTDAAMRAAIDAAEAAGDSVGGRCRIWAVGVPPGIGSFSQWDGRLDARIAAAMMSIPSVKGVLFGDIERCASAPGSEAHDIITAAAGDRPQRPSNYAGGLEGGLTNGNPIVAELLVKPVPTLGRSLPSVDLVTGRETPAPALRADICVVPAVGVIGEAMLALELAAAVIEQFGGDTMDDLQRSWKAYRDTRGQA
jgi:chorismate synthase